MYYTELMKEILTSERAQTIVQQISPRYGDAYVSLWILQAVGSVQDEMKEWSESLADQTRPETATWFLPYWEQEYGIAGDSTWPIERRRQNVINKIRNRAPMNPTKLADIIAVASGAKVEIEENTGKNHFTVHLSGVTKIENLDYIRKEISKAKPAHLIYDLDIREVTECNVNTFVGIAMTEYIQTEVPVKLLK